MTFDTPYHQLCLSGQYFDLIWGKSVLGRGWATQCILLRVLGKNVEFWAGPPSATHHIYIAGKGFTLHEGLFLPQIV